MNVEEIRIAVSKRSFLHPNDDYETKECWKKETSLLSEDITETIFFFKNVCTDEEFFWLSEVFADVSEIVQSKEFIKVLRSRLAQVSRNSYIQKSFKSEHMRKWIDYDEYVRSVSMEIDYAEGALNEE